MHDPLRTTRLALAVLTVSGWIGVAPALAQSRAETLRYVTGGVVNTLDPVMLGGTPEATALSTSTYDRLLRFGRKPAGNGTFVFDYDRIEGELAERYDVSPDGLTITLHLRPTATWQDGSPVTADDVKWSLDRAVSAPSMSKAQVGTGSLTSPDQFRRVDDHTVQIRLERADRLALPNLATTYLPMYNSKLAKQHATAEDPWAGAWLKDHTASGGAYRVQSFEPGKQVVLVRNDRWANGPRPAFARVILQTIPEATTRANLIERGDADLSIGLQGEDLKALERSSAVRVAATPMPTGFGALIFNTQKAPFDQPLVRQALALALPYDGLFGAALDGRGARLYGASWTGEPPTADFPQPLPLRTDLALARTKLAEAGYPNGFATTLAYSVSRAAFADPAASLIQEAFGKIGVAVKIDKMADAQFAAAVTDKTLPMLLERSLALFPSTEYFFRIFMSGPSRWNFSSWKNAEVDALLPQARYEPDQAKYDALARKLIGIAADQVPMAMIWKPSYDVVMNKSITGFTTWYNYYPDLRDLRRE
ncbi:ABC transporter substrate-binding protein [Methylobacterium terricola]|uniref:ABC transporter substrate-binding protein n=1 Tax=Methylobacterium terricola TaxID=2583531 RepID=A0A5C4L9D6_9HYPH|nr:ABC transporter substrate-binding protein [Methylobacterium terricola]TNC07301.1 ABC transporter substrate-binding protein [Methylobacterium terricola]